MSSPDDSSAVTFPEPRRGSGLGLSIAKDLTTLQGGKFELIIDGDLFKAQITFPIKN